MAWEVKWAQAALDDLDTIANYIARDSPNYAAAFVLELLDAARSLAQLAERGRVVPEWHEQTTRELLVGNYRLIIRRLANADRLRLKRAVFEDEADGWIADR